MLLHHCSALLTHFCYNIQLILLIAKLISILNVCKNQEVSWVVCQSHVAGKQYSVSSSIACYHLCSNLPFYFFSLSITVILVLQSSTKRSDHYVGAVVEFAPTESDVLESPQEVISWEIKWIQQSTNSKLLGSHFQHWQVPRLHDGGCGGGGGHHRVPGVRADWGGRVQPRGRQSEGQAVHGGGGGRQVRGSDW